MKKIKDVIIILIVKAIWKENVQVGRNVVNTRRNYKLWAPQKCKFKWSMWENIKLGVIHAVCLNMYYVNFKKSSCGKR